ncbi:hypothetical protein BaRGS_00029289 [Batillaria attramentaria]|uniref:Uncharacterized protein n=1 Tax=Batillaria attramentaria TaxID=370345 RepID=A0ABD0JY87_9CAEN
MMSSSSSGLQRIDQSEHGVRWRVPTCARALVQKYARCLLAALSSVNFTSGPASSSFHVQMLASHPQLSVIKPIPIRCVRVRLADHEVLFIYWPTTATPDLSDFHAPSCMKISPTEQNGALCD